MSYLTTQTANSTKIDRTSAVPDVDARRVALDRALLEPRCGPALWELVDSGEADEIVPELPALRLEQDPIHRHKDVLAHTIAVTAKTSPRLKVRLAALFHDIGKPATRKIDDDGVTFRHHEAVGAKITRRRLKALGYEPEMVADVSELVRLSGRFKGYADGWSDSAVRRYARDAGHLLGELNELVRCDCTTRNRRKAVALQEAMDELEERIADLAEADRRARERPAIDGQRVMELLDLPPGPLVGEALRHLLELRRAGDAVTPEAAEDALRAWWKAHDQG
ncbi:MAG: HDIG domain-containing protein [Actinomycetota bacterium]|nr:HDIG domain-containing protein [Actinomycetota bacterium]